MDLKQLHQAVKNSSIIPSLELNIYPEITSTNQQLWQDIEDKLSLPRVAIALQQSAGRGQWGRTWQSLPGGLYLSVAIEPNLPIICAPHLTFAVAWGLATKLRSLDIPVLLKWPNDLVLNGRKLGGIKLETRVSQQIITHTVIGVGINYINPVPPTGINLQSLTSTLSLEKLALIALEGIFFGYDYYLKNGIKQLLESYHQLFSNLGQKITFNDSPGIVLGVTEKGELRLRLFSPGSSVEISLEPGTISLGYVKLY
jgi:BirA family biotin operon repressor/biotin-[acetyl-CoA-carboxylase] ligase